ncbi:MAG: ABC transporter permease [Anaerolineae bacterium]|nr:ABC transporter permease [Anaerolineae bacterium]
MLGSRYVLKKIGWAVLTILFVIVLNFFLFRILPGDPARSGVRDPRLTAQAVEAIRVRFGLDKPIINCFQSLNPVEVGDCFVNPMDTQFFIYARNLLQGELGISYHSNRPVADLLLERLWNTVLLVGMGQILSIIIGIVIGVIAAWKVRTSVDYGALIGGLVAWSLPTFWLGIILLMMGSRHFDLPIGGKITPGATYANAWEQVLDVGRHMILPTLTFTIVFVGEYLFSCAAPWSMCCPRTTS